MAAMVSNPQALQTPATLPSVDGSPLPVPGDRLGPCGCLSERDVVGEMVHDFQGQLGRADRVSTCLFPGTPGSSQHVVRKLGLPERPCVGPAAASLKPQVKVNE